MAWDAGALDDGSDSCAREVAPKEHWPEMRALILVVSDAKKDVSSTAGMQQTVATSLLFATRARDVVPQRMKEMEKAIKERNFENFAKVTMSESNSFHACCLDTAPPIFYLNDVSRAAIRAIEGINARAGKAVAAYTFDAGPNCVVYFLEENKGVIISGLEGALGTVEGWPTNLVGDGAKGKKGIEGQERVMEVLKTGVSRVIYTSVGEGPVSVQEHLVDEKGEIVR